MKNLPASLLITGLICLGCAEGEKDRQYRPNMFGMDPADVERACVLHTACFPAGSSVSGCVSLMTSLVDADVWTAAMVADSAGEQIRLVSMLLNYDCVRRVTGGCRGVYYCLTEIPDITSCQFDRWKCISDTMYRACDWGQDRTTSITVDIDWSILGLICMDVLGRPLCTLPAPANPPERPDCDGDVSRWYNQGMMFEAHCGGEDMTCNPCPYGDGHSVCIGLGEVCEMPYQEHYQMFCKGNKETICLSERQALHDCGRSWRVCKNYETWGQCGFDGCDSDLFGDSCEGDSIKYCGVEGWTLMDCKEQSFSTCGYGGSYEIATCVSSDPDT